MGEDGEDGFGGKLPLALDFSSTTYRAFTAP